MQVHNLQDLTTTITPTDAADMLARNSTNRPINKNSVARYAREMETGEWMENGQTILIGSNNQLLDGQHRLTACVRSNTPFKAIVIGGLTPTTMLTIDTGRSRTASDILGIFGYKNVRQLTALTRLALTWGKDSRELSAFAISRIDIPEILRRVEEEPELQAYADPNPAQVVGLSGSAHNFLNYLLQPIDGEWAEEYFRILAGGGVDNPVGHPIIALRNRLALMLQEQHSKSRGIQIAFGIKAWNAWRDGRTLQIMKMAPNEKIQTPH